MVNECYMIYDIFCTGNLQIRRALGWWVAMRAPFMIDKSVTMTPRTMLSECFIYSWIHIYIYIYYAYIHIYIYTHVYMMYNPPTNITGWWCTLQESSVTERRRAGLAVPIRFDPFRSVGSSRCFSASKFRAWYWKLVTGTMEFYDFPSWFFSMGQWWLMMVKDG